MRRSYDKVDSSSILEIPVHMLPNASDYLQDYEHEVTVPLLDSKEKSNNLSIPGINVIPNFLQSNYRPKRSFATTQRNRGLLGLHNIHSFDVSDSSCMAFPQGMQYASLSETLVVPDMHRTVEDTSPLSGRILDVPVDLVEDTVIPSIALNAKPKTSVASQRMSIDKCGSDEFLRNSANPNATQAGRTLVGGMRRKLPSFRSKFGRFQSLRRFDSNSTNNVNCLGVNVSTESNNMKDFIKDAKVKFVEDASTGIDEDQEQKQSRSSYLKEQFFAFFQPADNKLAMKLFGNKNAVNKEKERQKQEGKFIIHPCSNFRFYWDVLMLILLIANLIILPVAISFFSDDSGKHWLIFNCVSDTIFLCDIAVNFRTGFVRDDFADEVILNQREIAKHYMKTWFFVDIISSIPVDYIFIFFNDENYSQVLHAGRTLRILRLAKLLSMLRLLRLSRLVRYVSQWEEFLNLASKFMGIFNLVLLMLLLGHWNACLQFLIPTLLDYPETSWVVKCKLVKSDWFHQYTWALFKAMSHMLSIGYGRFPPVNVGEAWITIISMMTGSTCYALFVGHAAALIQSFDTSKRLYREKFKQVEEYMAYRKLPRALRQRIANYYEHRYQGKMFNETEILGELSECLREQIINYNCRALVAAVPFFTYADQDFVSEVVTKLIYEVFQPGDLIIKEGTIGTKMYFIQEGIVDIITKDGEVATSLSDGSYFGEICLLTNAKRVASVRAEVYCNLYSLDREHFLAVLDNYPLMRRTMESVAAERLNKIGQNPNMVSNREDLTEDLNIVKEIVSAVTPGASDDEDDKSNSPSNPTTPNEHSGHKASSPTAPLVSSHSHQIRLKLQQGIAKALHKHLAANSHPYPHQYHQHQHQHQHQNKHSTSSTSTHHSGHNHHTESTSSSSKSAPTAHENEVKSPTSDSNVSTSASAAAEPPPPPYSEQTTFITSEVESVL